MDKFTFEDKEKIYIENYEDILKQNLRQYKKLLEDNIISEEEYNKIVQSVRLNLKEDFELKKDEKKINKFIKCVKKIIYWIMQGFKYYFSIIMIASSFIATPYHLHTIIFFICGILLFPNIQRKISIKYNKDRKFELCLSIIVFFVYFCVLLISIYSFENVENTFFYVDS